MNSINFQIPINDVIHIYQSSHTTRIFCLSIILSFLIPSISFLFVISSFFVSVFLSFHICSILFVYFSLIYWTVLGCGLRWPQMVLYHLTFKITLGHLRSSQVSLGHLGSSQVILGHLSQERTFSILYVGMDGWIGIGL